MSALNFFGNLRKLVRDNPPDFIIVNDEQLFLGKRDLELICSADRLYSYLKFFTGGHCTKKCQKLKALKSRIREILEREL